MKPTTLAIYILLIFLSQLSIVVSLDKSQILPNLVIIGIIWLIFNASLWDALTGAVILGFLLDVYSVNPFGIYALIAILNVAGFSWLLRHTFPKEEKIGLVVLAFSAYYISIIGVHLLINLTYGAAELDFSRFFNFKYLLNFGLSILFYYPFSAILRRYITTTNE